MVAQLPVPLAMLSPDGSISWANRSFRRAFNLRGDDLRRKGIEQLLPAMTSGASGQGAAKESWAEWIGSAQLGTAPPPRFIEIGAQTARAALVPMRNGDDELDTLLVVEIGASEAAPVGDLVPPDLPAIVWTADAESTDFRTVAGAAEEFLGYPLSHWLDRPGFFEERIHPDDRALVMELYRSLLNRGGDGSAEFRAVTAAGQAFWCRESIRVASVGGTPRGITGVLTNITRRKQLEQQLLSGARMEATQNLAGRLAHDLNNPLMIIQGYGEDMLQSLGPINPLRADAQEIMNAATRISSVAGKLTEFARQPAQAAVKVDAVGIIANLKSRLVEVAGPRVTLELTTPTHPLWAMADADQLAEVILTLASHNREGTQDRTRLTVTCTIDTITERFPQSTLTPGFYIRISLRDDGRGIEPSKLAAIFDPSIHPADAHTLAMSRAHGLVRHWGGDIGASSELNRGSEFAIFLQSADIPAAAPIQVAPVPVFEPEPIPEPEPLRETILIVDDESGIRGLMRKILKREHYNVIEASNAEDALKEAAAHHGPIHLLLTDVMLPGMLGPELARKMYALDTSLRVLYISGYTQDERVRTGEYPPGARFLAKPFTLSALLEKVRQTLDAPGG
jgi:PAS domain S-box-containing protein